MQKHELNGDIFPKGPLKILYFDDNEDDLIIMQRFFREEKKICLECVNNKNQFNEQMSKSKFNCLILDYNIPDFNVFDALFKLFEEDPKRPIITVSGVLHKKLSASLLDFPFLRFITKDKLSKELIMKIIIELIHAAQIRKENFPQEGGVLGYETKLLKQQFYVDVIETMDEGLVTVDEKGAIIFVNKTLLRLLGYRNQDLLGQSIYILVPNVQVSYFSMHVDGVLSTNRKITFELECKAKNDTIVPVLAHSAQMRNEYDKIIGAFFTMTDLSNIKYKELQLMETNMMLKKQSRIDGLTGLLNHHSLRECLELEFMRSKGENKPLILIMVDIDYFKLINNNIDLGHNFGDFILKEISKIIQDEIGPKDVLARNDADEFIIALVDSDYEKGISMANILRQKVAEYLFQEGELSSRLTISIGVASSRIDKARSALELLSFADKAVCQAKAKGRNTVVAYSEAIKVSTEGVLEKQRDQINVIEEQLVNLADTSKKIYMESARALIAALEAKDPYTKTHSVNVAAYAAKIAKKLGLSLGQVEMISDAAQLHDIGKIGIPESILLKTDRLTADEYAVVKKHPLISIQILKRIKYLESELPIILCHHERPDGKGYPTGLYLEDIPLGAQIISVADSYDAMTSLRSYRKALAMEDAVRELTENSGTQFNAEVVVVFLEVLLEEATIEGKEVINSCLESLKNKIAR